jgi:thiamine pyrophosphate-dependent acetolactate synthase large subunit-like protein
MNVQAVAEIKKNNTKNTILLFNNHIPQNISMDQMKTLGKTVQCEVPTVDYAGIAEGFGLQYRKIVDLAGVLDFFEKTDFETTQTLAEFELKKDDYPLSE